MFKKLLAETIGTYMLVLIGCGAIVVNGTYNGVLTHLGVSAAFGIVVTGMIYAFGKTSGAHINPAVTIAFWISGSFKKALVVPYVVSQIAGAILASWTIYSVFPSHVTQGATLPSGSYATAFLIEFVLTWVLMLVILIVSTTATFINKYAAIVIGLVVFIEAFIAGPYTGASMNPARSIAPALFSSNLNSMWIYIIATTVGAVTAVPTFMRYSQRLKEE